MIIMETDLNLPRPFLMFCSLELHITSGSIFTRCVALSDMTLGNTIFVGIVIKFGMLWWS